MLNRFLFVLLSTLFCLSVCYGEYLGPITLDPRPPVLVSPTILTDTISLEHVSVPPLKSIYLKEISVWGGLPIPGSLVPGHITILNMDGLNSLHLMRASTAIELATGGLHNCLGYVGQPCFASIRAFNPGGVLFLKDGIPVNDDWSGAFDVSRISLVSLSKMEIMSECGSSIYGPNGADAVVNLVTKTFKGGLPYSRVAVFGGSDNLRKTEMEFGRSFGPNWCGYVSGAYLKEDGFKPHADSDIKDFNADLSCAVGGMKAGVSVWRRDGKVGIPEDTIGLSQPVGVEDRFLLGTAYVKGNSFDARLHYKDLWHGDSDSLNNSLGVRTVKSMGVDVKKAVDLHRKRISFGVTGGRMELDAGDSLSCEVLDGGANLAANFEVLPLIYVDPGVSFWYNEVYGSEVSPKLSVSMIYNLGFVLFASVSRGFNVPNIRELFSPTSGNEELKPEHTQSFSGGLRYESDNVSMSVHGFAIETKDLIEPESDSASQSVNTDYVSRVRGLTIETKGWASFARAGMNLRLAASEHSRTGEELPYAPRVSVAGYVGYNGVFRRGDLGVNVTADGRYAGERVSDDGLSLPGYGVLNLCGEIRIVNLRMSYRVENLLDEEYESVSGYPMPGRTLVYGLDWEFWN